MFGFSDETYIDIASGNGGHGCVSFRREKFVPKGGPDGGDGGRGGDVVFVVKDNLRTLGHLKLQRSFRAENGRPGQGARCAGRDGKDVEIPVPPGTVIRNAETGELIKDLTGLDRYVFLEGGRGGLGNWQFKSATNRTPRYAQPGEPGIEKAIILELKLLADVGLVGFPNAGKSTLLSAVSAAKPKIANYPFTTLEPNLGIVSYRDRRSFVMADIPGSIEGASEGRGLGLRFLRHIERNAVLLFMIPADSDDIVHEYDVLCNELATFNPDLADKPRVLAITKCDLLDDELMDEIRQNHLPAGVDAVFISAVAGLGLLELKDMLWREINDEKNRIPTKITHRDLDERHRVKEEDEFIFSEAPAEEEEDYADAPDMGGRMQDEDRWDDEYWPDEDGKR